MRQRDPVHPRAEVVTASDPDATPLRHRRGVYRPAGLVQRAGIAVSGGSRSVVAVAMERDTARRASRIFGLAMDRAGQRCRPTRARMRALVLRKPGRLEWTEVPAPPAPGPGAAVVRPVAMATCDLDRPLGLGHTAFPLPLQIGHECVAEVVSVGDGVQMVAVGDLVVVPFQVSCGQCRACVRGFTGNCRSVPPLAMFGFGAAGGMWGGVMADLVAVPFADAMLVALPGGVDPVVAASSADTLSDAYRHVGPHVDDVRDHPDGPAVIVVGAVDASSRFSASMPMFAGLITRALLPEADFLLVDARPWVRNHAERLGLAATSVGGLRRRQAPLVVDASASPRGLRYALSAVAPDGRCSCAGSLHAAAQVPAALMFGRNVTLSIARSHIRRALPQVMGLLSGGLNLAEVITQRGSFDDARELMEAHLRGQEIKTVLTAT